MLRREIDHLIPFAFEAIEATEISTDKKTVPDGYISKISSFGATVITMGLKPALVVYSADASKTKIATKDLMDALLHILRKAFPEQEYNVKDDLLSLSLLLDRDKLELFKVRILHASVALKLALRTFKEEKHEQEER